MSSPAPIQIESIPEGIAELVASAPFKKLTRQQKTWVLEYLSNGHDAIAAARVAYPSALPHSQVCISYQVAQSPAVQDVLEFWKWRDARSALIAICQKNLRAAEPGSTAAGKFAVQLERLTLGVVNSNKAQFQDPDAPVAEPRVETVAAPAFIIGQRVTERDAEGVLHVGVVVAVSADGTPIYEEVTP
jgi:hypothetical protein